MDSEYAAALRGIRANGQEADFIRSATEVMTEQELRSIINAAEYSLNKYRKYQTKFDVSSRHPVYKFLGVKLVDISNSDLDHLISRRWTISKTMLKSLKAERKRRNDP